MSLITLLPAVSVNISERQRKDFNPASMDTLRKDIQANGLMHPIVVYRAQEDGGGYNLIAGERRYRAMLDLQAEGIIFECASVPVSIGNIPCTVFNNMEHSRAFEMELNENLLRAELTWQERTEAVAELHKLRVAQNPAQTYTDTAEEIAAASPQETKASMHQKTEVRKAAIVADFLDVPEVRKASSAKAAYRIASSIIEKEFVNARVKTAPVSQLHTLMHGDMMELSDTIETGSVTLLLTDPPYGIGVEDFGDAAQLSRDYKEDNVEELHVKLVEIASRVCHEDAHAYVFCDLDLFHFIRGEFEKAGWRVRRVPLVVYKGTQGHLSEGGVLGFRRSYEFILVAWRGSRNFSGLLSDVFMENFAGDKYHADQKPESLYVKLINQSSDVGDTIFDPFAGSGVIFGACTTTERIAIGIELSPDSTAMIESRQGVLRE